jgi:hypothetical protein
MPSFHNTCTIAFIPHSGSGCRIDGVTKLTQRYTEASGLDINLLLESRGAPTTQLLTFTTPIHKLNSGFGAYVLHDQLGPQNNLEIQAMYAYHLGIKDSKLSIASKGWVLFHKPLMAESIDPIQRAIPVIIEGEGNPD